jgi:hypothetical protein
MTFYFPDMQKYFLGMLNIYPPLMTGMPVKSRWSGQIKKLKAIQGN